MKKPLIISIIILSLIIIGILAWFVYQVNSDEKEISNSCTKLGCSEQSLYVGSINSDKYYECDCYYADRIKPENIICFVNEADAQSKGYIKSGC